MAVNSYGEHMIQYTRMTFVNVQLVREENGFTLVDTGMGGSANAILAIAKQYGAPIRRILLTHAHIDHVGSVDALHALLPEAEIMISARDSRFLHGDMSMDPGEDPAKLRGGYPIIQTVPTRLLQPGDKVGSLHVIASPGHTPGHIAYFDRRDGTLLAGDAFSNKSGLTTAGTLRILFPFTAMATWSKPTGLQSAEALLALQPKRLAVGHGKVVENPIPAMERAIAEARRSIEKAQRA